jgi:hypothetical protein
VLPGYYQGEDMEINFSILNPGGIRYTGIPEITISNGEDRKTITPELDLAANESQRFTVMLKAPQKPGNHKLLVSFKIDEYSTVDNSVDYQVRALNPAVTTISSDLEENNGIYGTATIGSPFSAEFVDWNTTATVKVYWIAENGKKEVCSKNIPVTRETFNIALPYSDFYRGDGQYLVTIDTGGVQDTIYFDITGSDFVYTPAGEELPATIVSNELYLQLMVLLIGSFGALTVRNHLHPGRPSIPLNILAIVCGIAVLATAVLIANPGMVVVGVIILGLGVGISVVDKSDPLGAMFIESSHLHDFVGIILVFLSVAYIAIHVPQWSFGIIIGTLIAYYVGLNFHREE